MKLHFLFTAQVHWPTKLIRTLSINVITNTIVLLRHRLTSAHEQISMTVKQCLLKEILSQHRIRH